MLEPLPAQPSAGVIDSQTIKAPMADKRGYDAGKKIVGRKRHIAVNLTTADISDSAEAMIFLAMGSPLVRRISPHLTLSNGL